MLSHRSATTVCLVQIQCFLFLVLHCEALCIHIYIYILAVLIKETSLSSQSACSGKQKALYRPSTVNRAAEIYNKAILPPCTAVATVADALLALRRAKTTSRPDPEPFGITAGGRARNNGGK